MTLTQDKLDKVSPAVVTGLDAVAGLIVAADVAPARLAAYREAGSAIWWPEAAPDRAKHHAPAAGGLRLVEGLSARFSRVAVVSPGCRA